MPVRLVVEAGPHAGVPRLAVTRAARAMLAAIDLADHELSIVLTSDERIHALNRDYRSKDKPTDVLAFAQREGPHAEHAGRLLGDVVVSVPTARRQAASASRDVLAEVIWLLAHGLLHLVGWDHDTPARDARMRRETARLVKAASGAPARAPAKKPARTRR